MYKRVLIKLSGEQLAGKYEHGVDPNLCAWLADEIKKVADSGIQTVIVAGGGNMIRGEEVAGNGIRRVTGEHMGMLSGLINSIALTDIFESKGIPTRCLSNIFAPQVAESYSYRLAEKHLEQKRVVIVAGGLGRPYFTHDSAAVNIAIELECQVVLKATKVDGVYDRDPATFQDAKKFENLSYQQAVEDNAIKVMDKAALGLAMEYGMPLIIFNAMEADNILKIVNGEPIGTKIA